ncbi:hypothetical protein PTKU46_58480 [Paraburkholderia terrae]
MRRQVQPAQVRCLDVTSPENQCPAGACSKHLFRGPQCIAGIGRSYKRHLVQRETDVSEPQSVWNVRWLKQHNWPHNCGQCRLEQAEFAHARLLHQQIDKRTRGPAAARQFA